MNFLKMTPISRMKRSRKMKFLHWMTYIRTGCAVLLTLLITDFVDATERVVNKQLGSIVNNDINNILLGMDAEKSPADIAADYRHAVDVLVAAAPGVLAQNVGLPDPVIYRTNVATTFDKFLGGPQAKAMAKLLTLDTDPLTMTIEICRKRNVPVVASYRMNAEDFRERQLDLYDFGRQYKQLRIAGANCLDPAHPQVYGHRMKIFTELANEYDIDGIEFDFRRSYRMVSDPQNNHAILTRMVVETREMLDEVARRKGRGRMLLGVRVGPLLDGPYRQEEFPGGGQAYMNLSCRDQGLDVRTWIEQEYVDYVCPTLFWPSWPGIPKTEEFTELAQGKNVGIYPTLFPLPTYLEQEAKQLGGIGIHDKKRLLRYKNGFCKAALQMYAAGADGISTFNWYYHLHLAAIPNQWQAYYGYGSGGASVQSHLLSILGDPQAIQSYQQQPWAIPRQEKDRPRLEYHQPGIELSLVAEHPDVVAPTGIDVDREGRVWVVSSHTHFRPDDYKGPEHDEVVVLHPDGERRVFYDRTDATMDLELGEDGWVYLAERDRILRIRDTDDDGVADELQNLAVLETEADYPHNGLAGLAWNTDGDLMFTLGENFAKEWTLTGTDGCQVQGTGEGGVFRCRSDGRNLRRTAVGFWNPFGFCVRQDGEMFAVENDPGASPPCRLLHIVDGGNFGYQRLYGGNAFHPFVGWNGELRGTLPMLHAVGEAPCGVAPLGNGLLIGSWSDNRLDFYALTRSGASFEAQQIPLVSAAELFRPTCITKADDTTFYLADWVWGTYQLHGRGRVWKVEIDPRIADWWISHELEPPNQAATIAKGLRHGQITKPLAELLELAAGEDPYLADAAIGAMAQAAKDWSPDDLRERTSRDRVSMFLARKRAVPRDTDWPAVALADPSGDVQFEALRWIADHQLEQFAPQLDELLCNPNLNYRLFEACLAAHNTLAGNPQAGINDADVLISAVQSEQTPATLRAFVLRLLPADHKQLSLTLLQGFLGSPEQQLVLETVRTLSARRSADSTALLCEIASDADRSTLVRAEAIAGLAVDAGAHMPRLLSLVADDSPVIRSEALRALRFSSVDETASTRLAEVAEKFPETKSLVDAVVRPGVLKDNRPAMTDLLAWSELVANEPTSADPDAGRRIFYHAKVGLCANCHRHLGRGNIVGPDLTAVASTGDRQRLLQAILQPSRDVDPQYHPRFIETEDGRTFTGIMLRKGGRTSREYYRDAQGQERAFLWSEIVVRKDLQTSLMPDGLVDTLTISELRDLLVFLEQGRLGAFRGTRSRLSTNKTKDTK